MIYILVRKTTISDFRNILGVSIPSVVLVVDRTMFTRIDRVLRIALIPGKYENCDYSKWQRLSARP